MLVIYHLFAAEIPVIFLNPKLILIIIRKFDFNRIHFRFTINRSIIYYLTTTVSAVVLGIILVTTIRPGDLGGDSMATNQTDKMEGKRVYTVDTLLDLIR